MTLYEFGYTRKTFFMDWHCRYQRSICNPGTIGKTVLGNIVLTGKGVEVRLIHAIEPGPNFRKDFDRYPLLAKRLKRILCPSVHFKILVIDQKICYVGSANLTGAGMGMKSLYRRNFEAGIITDASDIVNAAIEEFDKVWRGSECLNCQRKKYCPDPIT